SPPIEPLSNKATCQPSWAKRHAIDVPMIPPPTTATRTAIVGFARFTPVPAEAPLPHFLSSRSPKTPSPHGSTLAAQGKPRESCSIRFASPAPLPWETIGGTAQCAESNRELWTRSRQSTAVPHNCLSARGGHSPDPIPDSGIAWHIRAPPGRRLLAIAPDPTG